jgi:hypothetical protein
MEPPNLRHCDRFAAIPIAQLGTVVSRPLTNGQDGHASVTNIPFEQLAADVIAYTAEYWLLFKGEAKYLTYTQTILMVLIVKGQKYVFPHVTCNTVTYTP